MDLNIFLLHLKHTPYNLFWYCVGSSSTKCSRDQYICLRDHGLNECDATQCLFVWDEQGFNISCFSKRCTFNFIHKSTYTYYMMIHELSSNDYCNFNEPISVLYVIQLTSLMFLYLIIFLCTPTTKWGRILLVLKKLYPQPS